MRWRGMSKPVFVSAIYFRYLASVMEESGLVSHAVYNMGDWLNAFKMELQDRADAQGKSIEELCPTIVDLYAEEIRLVKDSLGE